MIYYHFGNRFIKLLFISCFSQLCTFCFNQECELCILHQMHIIIDYCGMQQEHMSAQYIQLCHYFWSHLFYRSTLFYTHTYFCHIKEIVYNTYIINITRIASNIFSCKSHSNNSYMLKYPQLMELILYGKEPPVIINRQGLLSYLSMTINICIDFLLFLSVYKAIWIMPLGFTYHWSKSLLQTSKEVASFLLYCKQISP